MREEQGRPLEVPLWESRCQAVYCRDSIAEDSLVRSESPETVSKHGSLLH